MKLVTITPQMAHEMIESRSYGRRTVNPKFVEHLANEIREGRWEPSRVSPILMDSHMLFDGLQRLTAIMEAGVPVECYVSDGSV